MKANTSYAIFSPWKSITTRVILLGVGMMLVALVALGLYAGHRQRLDMQQQLGAQQSSTVGFIAALMDREFELRIDALTTVAEPITPAVLSRPAEVRRLMAERPVFQGYFNGGTYATDMHGQPVAMVAGTASSVVNDQSDAQQVAALLQSSAASLVFLSGAQSDVLHMAVPIRHQGRTIGALVGTNQLALPNFLDTLAQSRYGQHGAYVLYAAPQRKVVKASGFAASAGNSPAYLAFLQQDGFLNPADGTHVGRAPDGQEMLISSRSIGTARWTISVLLPTAEAFAIVTDQQQRLWIFTLGFALFLGLAAWWILRQQFTPIRSTVDTLENMAQSGGALHALDATGQQEIDSLIASFNHLLSALADRNTALQDSLALNQDTLNSLAEHVAVVDAKGAVLAVNKTWTDYSVPSHLPVQADAAGHAHFGELFDEMQGHESDEAQQELLAGIQSVLSRRQLTFACEYHIKTPTGGRWLHLSVTPLGGSKQGAVLSRSDITERKQADARLRKLSHIADQAPLAILITDVQGQIEYSNPYFSEITGYQAQEVLGLNPRLFKSGLTPAETYQELWASLAAGKVWRGVFLNHRKDGTLLVERAVVAPGIDATGVVTHYVALKEDITESQRQEQRRQDLTVRIEELSRRLVKVQEDSRMRFSQELHDRTSPNLAALRINLDIIAQTLKPLELEASVFDRMEDTRALIDDTTLSIREICAGLHPVAIERGGLLGVLGTYCVQFSKRTGIQVDLRCPHEDKRLDADLELALFRIVQEALANCAKHAQAQTVEVRMQLDQRPLVLSISDDGCGFDAQAALNGCTLYGLGLVNMRDTVDFAGGRMRLDTAPGRGTRIYIEI